MKWGKEFFKNKSRRVYLDHAASTPVDQDIAELMAPYLSDEFYNPSALYQEALNIRSKIEESRGLLARSINAQPGSIIFTSGATEANQLIIVGTIEAGRQAGIETPEVVISAIEHPSIRNLCLKYAKDGLIKLTELPVSLNGQITPRDLRKIVTPNTVLVSINMVNNEIGSVQPLKEVAKVLRWVRKQNKSIWPYLHTDAVQSASCFDLDVKSLGIDFMTLSSQKINGPKGVGFVYRKSTAKLVRPWSGGGQEDGYRSGTENVAAIIGGSVALQKTQNSSEAENARLSELRSWLIGEVNVFIPGVILHGSAEKIDQSPHILNFTIPNINGELMVIELAERGVLCAARAACSTDDEESSHVLAALYAGSDQQKLILESGSIRLSMGKNTKKDDLIFAIKQIQLIIKKYQSA